MDKVLRTQRYTTVARSLHWLIVGLIVVQFCVAWTMPDIEHGTQPVGLIVWHLSVGATILAVMLLRLFWRLTHAPPPPADLPQSLQLVSRFTHYLLYILLIALPFGGWANASARGWPVKLFGVLPLPAIAPQGSAWGMAAGDIHMTAATGLLVVIALHIAGSIYHALFLKDDTVQRMI